MRIKVQLIFGYTINIVYKFVVVTLIVMFLINIIAGIDGIGISGSNQDFHPITHCYDRQVGYLPVITT